MGHLSIHYEVIDGPEGWVRLILPGQLPGGSKHAAFFNKASQSFRPRRRKNPETGEWEPTAFERWIGALRGLTQIGKIQRPPAEPWEGPVLVQIRYWWGDRRKRDKPGLEEALWAFLALKEKKFAGKRHKLNGTGWVRDDSQLNPAWELMGLDRDNPRAEIILWRLRPTDI